MHNKEEIDRIRKAKEEWEKGPLQFVLDKWAERQETFETISGRNINRIYTPLDVPEKDYLGEISFPGEYPFTRGALPTGYPVLPRRRRPTNASSSFRPKDKRASTSSSILRLTITMIPIILSPRAKSARTGCLWIRSEMSR